VTGQPAGIHGPSFPDIHALRAAQAAPCDADLAGCSDAEYDRLILERQQTEAAYLEGYDRELARDLEREPAPDPAGQPVPYTLTPQAEEELALAAEAEGDWSHEWDDADSNAYQARLEAALEPGGPECYPYPAFGDDPAKWGLLPEPPMPEAELAAAAEFDAWGPRGPSASYAEWAREGLEPEPEAEP